MSTLTDRKVTGMITDIQCFSTHDGPGIRTTVFLKGCNLSCYWCHNYETISPRRQLQYDAGKCIGCGKCLPVCPAGAQVCLEGQHLLDRAKCRACFKCVAVCFSGALQVVGVVKSAGEVFDLIAVDQDFYQNSGGGVTLSGGEALLQPQFAAALLGLCQANGIHTAIETNLAWPWERVTQLIEKVNLVMTDIKCIDSRRHQAATGVGNGLVLENIKKLAAVNAAVIIRTPVIKGFNDCPTEIKAIADYIHDLKNLSYYELLTYNPLGSEKPLLLGDGASIRKLEALNKDQMKQLGYKAKASGIKVLIDGKELI